MVDRIMNCCRLGHKEQKIDTILYDTGARLYENMKNIGLHYIDMSFYCHPAFVTHFCGVTRNAMYEDEPVSVSENDIENYIRERLLTEYNFELNF